MARFNHNLLNENGIFKICLFLCLISFIFSDVELVKFGENNFYAQYNHIKGTKSQTIELGFEKNIPEYVKVLITPNVKIETPLLCFSDTSESCSSDRQILAKRTDGLPLMIFIKKEQFQSGHLYIFVTCQEEKCGYTLKFNGAEIAEIDANSVFSYLVTKNNQEMKFLAIGEAENGNYLTIGVEGSSTVNININDISNYEQYQFDYGKILTFSINNTKNKNLATFTINGANIGDYLTINIHVVNINQTSDNLLYPNGPVVMGMLSRKDDYFKEECFPVSAFSSEKYSKVSKFYLTGNIHSKYGLFWLVDEKNNILKNTEKEISDGLLSFVIETNGLKRSICFGFSKESVVKNNYVAYSISILEQTKLESLYNFYPPQSIGQVYRRMIQKATFVVFQAGTVEEEDKTFNFNLYNIKGVTEMYVTKCSTFPNCNYTIETIRKFEKPKRLNRMTFWETTVDKTYGALNQEKYIMIIYCKDDDNENNGYCEFDTSVNVAGKSINLVEKEQFSKFVLKDDKGTIKIDSKEGIQIQGLTIDIIIYSGDVSFNVKGLEDKLNNLKLGDGEIEVKYDKYYLSNKIFYHFNFGSNSYSAIEIEYIASLNSFFTIKYEINPYSSIQIKENVLSDENYLIQIDPKTSDKSKNIYLPNYRYKKSKPFLASFFSLNCDLNITRKENSNSEKQINFIDGYAQEILLSSNLGYNSQNYEYKIKILEEELSNYNNKMCMLYVSGYEPTDLEFQTEIVIGENINQQIIFNSKLKSVRFLYPQADPEKDLSIYINTIDKAYYTIKIYTNTEEKSFKEYSLTRSKIYYIEGKEILSHCKKNTLCSIIIETSFTNKINIEEPQLEIMIKQNKNIPLYLQKNKAIKDIIYGDIIYYYTEIGKNEIGEISVNFLKNSGNVYGKIVKKNQNADKNSNWRGIYKYPSKEDGDSLPINEYTQKMYFGIEETKDCIEGCYLLLTIQASTNTDTINSDFYPFFIITRIKNDAYIPKVSIKVNEYIVGNVNLTENDRIYQLYEVWLPYDSDRVDFDFQSELAGLYINLGGITPTIKNYDFKLLPSTKDSILFLDKIEIITKAKSKNIKLPYDNSLQGLNLVIGVWTDKTDSVDIESFSLNVLLPNNNANSLDIIEINNEHKILCKPKKLNDTYYNCLFMVIYDDEDVKKEKNLIIHAASVNKNVLAYTYGKFIEKEYYDEYDTSNLQKLIPNSGTSEFNTQGDENDYIYTTLSPNNSEKYYFYVNVITNSNDDIFILTSMPIYNNDDQNNLQFYLKPFTEQLLSVSVEKLNLKFLSESSIFVKIYSLGGEANIKWEDDPNNIYNLKGKGEILSLTSGKKTGELIFEKKNELNGSKRNLLSSEEPVFIFYISYYKRNSEINLDKIDYEKNIEIGYKQTDLPIYLYSKIGKRSNDINIALTFKDIDINTNENGEYSNSPLIITGSLVKENTIYLAKQYLDLQPKLKKFAHEKYDPILKTEQIFISNEFFDYYKIKSEDNPTLYISIEKTNKSDINNYDKFSIDVEISEANNGIVPEENVYHFGKYNGNDTIYYKLKSNKEYIILEISFNSECLDFSINEEIKNINSTNIINSSIKERGKVILIIKPAKTSQFIYLNIFKNKKSDINDILLNNYVFKYSNVEKEEDFFSNKILENNEEFDVKKVRKNGKTFINCTFNKIIIENFKPNITYFLKIIYNEQYHKGESYESISLMESPYYAVYKTNPSDNNGTITLSGIIDYKDIIYLQIIAKIQQEKNLEYISYKGMNYSKNQDEEKEEEDKEEEEEKKEEEKDEKEDEKKDDKDDDSNTNVGGKLPSISFEILYLWLIAAIILLILLIIIAFLCITLCACANFGCVCCESCLCCVFGFLKTIKCFIKICCCNCCCCSCEYDPEKAYKQLNKKRKKWKKAKENIEKRIRENENIINEEIEEEEEEENEIEEKDEKKEKEEEKIENLLNIN